MGSAFTLYRPSHYGSSQSLNSLAQGLNGSHHQPLGFAGGSRQQQPFPAANQDYEQAQLEARQHRDSRQHHDDMSAVNINTSNVGKDKLPPGRVIIATNAVDKVDITGVAVD